MVEGSLHTTSGSGLRFGALAMALITLIALVTWYRSPNDTTS